MALSLGFVVASLPTVLMSVGVALFVALALDPLVRRMETKGVSRGRGIAIVFTVFAIVIDGILIVVVPAAVGQVVAFAQAVPSYLNDVKQSQWFQSFVATTGGSLF